MWLGNEDIPEHFCTAYQTGILARLDTSLTVFPQGTLGGDQACSKTTCVLLILTIMSSMLPCHAESCRAWRLLQNPCCTRCQSSQLLDFDNVSYHLQCDFFSCDFGKIMLFVLFSVRFCLCSALAAPMQTETTFC